MNEVANTNKRTPIDLDGFSSGYSSPATANNNAGGAGLDGLKLKFSNDARWLDPNEDEVRAALIALDVINRVQKWPASGGAPLETITLKPGEPWPSIGELNAACPEDEWYTKFGKFVGPWAGEHVLLFVDPATMTRYWWPSPAGNVGACICIRELMGQTALMRKFRGQRVFPVVQPSHTFMPTQYGGRERPHLPILKWVVFGAEPSALPDQSTMKVIEEATTPAATTPTAPATTAPALQEVARPSLEEELDDKIEF